MIISLPIKKCFTEESYNRNHLIRNQYCKSEKTVVCRLILLVRQCFNVQLFIKTINLHHYCQFESHKKENNFNLCPTMCPPIPKTNNQKLKKRQKHFL